MGIRPLKLGGLSKDATAQLLHELSQRQAAPDSLVSLMFEETQGHPLFVEEVYRHLLEEEKVFDAAGRLPCVDYYRGARTHLSLDKNCSLPPDYARRKRSAKVIAAPWRRHSSIGSEILRALLADHIPNVASIIGQS